MSNKTEIAEILQGHVIQLIMWSQHGGPHLAELFILFFDMKVILSCECVYESLAAMSI